MGCKYSCFSSKSSKKNVVHPVLENTNVDENDDHKSSDEILTKTQIDLVQSTWVIVRQNKDENGAAFYNRLFNEYPEVLSMFSFGSDLDVHQIKQDERVIRQAKRLMNMIGNAVDGLGDIPNLVPVLKDLGATHLQYGVKEEHYEPVGATLLWTLKEGLADKFTPEAETAWTAVYTLISDTMKAGASEAKEVTGRSDEGPLSEHQIHLAQENWSYVRTDWKQHGLSFYKRLFSTHPEVLEFFSFGKQSKNLEDDERAINQAGRLMNMIGKAVDGLRDIPSLVPVLEELGVRHTQYGVKEEHYDAVGECLIWTLSEGLGEKFTEEAKKTWIVIYGLVAETMKNGARKATGDDHE